MLESPRVRRLINIAGRWQLLSRLAGDVSVLADTRWEAVLLRTQSDTARAVLELIDVLHPAAAQLRVENLESANGWEVEPSVVLTPEIVVVEHVIHAAAAVSWRTLERRAVRMAVVTVRPVLVRW